ncbi:MAG: 1-acyl-sn-glycerol-3-phosphate acyltransferase [Paramuribaculum sp.]|nr:1-acyl-sn-glycerol-3-phosphate acyltransferase [Paramuribaculum sp.]
MKWLSNLILRIAGWKESITVPDYPKVIICVAPHTSNWDFILGKLAYAAAGRRAGFLMKSSWFFFPLGLIFKSIGGVPVKRGKGSSLVETLIERYRTSDRLALAITPEGTRSLTTRWHTGFLRIALEANVPIVLGVLDFATKQILIEETFTPTGDIDSDLRRVKDYYRPFAGKYPDKFSAD